MLSDRAEDTVNMVLAVLSGLRRPFRVPPTISSTVFEHAPPFFLFSSHDLLLFSLDPLPNVRFFRTFYVWSLIRGTDERDEVHFRNTTHVSIEKSHYARLGLKKKNKKRINEKKKMKNKRVSVEQLRKRMEIRMRNRTDGCKKSKKKWETIFRETAIYWKKWRTRTGGETRRFILIIFEGWRTDKRKKKKKEKKYN